MKELIEKRNQLANTLHAELDAWEASTRSSTSNFDSEANGVWKEKIAKIEADLAKVEGQLAVASKRADLDKPEFQTRGLSASADSNDGDKEYEARFAKALFSGNRVQLERVMAERANVTTVTGSSAIPLEWQNRIVEKLSQVSIMRSLCPVRTVGADQKIVVGGNLPTTYKVTEASAITEDAAFSLANVDVLDLTYANYVPVSKQYSNDAIGGLDYIVRKCGESLGLKLEDEYTTGAGGAGNMPGLLTSILAGNKIAATGSGAVLADIDGDNIIDMVHKVAPQYRRGNFRIMLSDDALKAIRKIKITGSNEYLWKVGETADLTEGVPGTIYGVPYVVNQYMPTSGAASLPVVCGNFAYYEIYDRGGPDIMLDPYGLSTSLMTRVVVSQRTYGVNTNTDAFSAIVL